MGTADLIKVLTEAEEFAELPVRHNEDNLNEHLAGQLPIAVDNRQSLNLDFLTHFETDFQIS